jgi:nucleoside-diphosphate-sugar epimerase
MDYALVTGGLGFIGSNIARLLIRDNVVNKVVLLDHFGTYVSPVHNSGVDYRAARIADLGDRVIVERGLAESPSIAMHLIMAYKPKYIFHLAALPLASLQNMTSQEAMTGTCISTSVFLETIDVLRRAIEYLPERFVYASSSMVYGDFLYIPADETHPTQPRNIYGVMKLAGENCALGLGRAFGINVAVVRPSAVYGPTDTNRRVTQTFLESARKGGRLTVHGEDDALDFTYVEDCAAGFVLAAVRKEAIGEVFNITAGHGVKLVELAELLKKYFPALQYDVVPRDATRPKRGPLSIEKANKLLGYTPKYDIKAGFEAYIDFSLRNSPPT